MLDLSSSIEFNVHHLKASHLPIISCSSIKRAISSRFQSLHRDIVTCTWHGWKYCVKNGKSPNQGGDSVNSYEVKLVEETILYVKCTPSSF